MAIQSVSNATRDFYRPGIPEMKSFYSVEIQVDKSDFRYQFKIWKILAELNFILIKEGSNIMSCLHPGDILSMTYYSDDLSIPKQQLPTQIINVIKQDVGRFRGHYMVTLGIVDN